MPKGICKLCQKMFRLKERHQKFCNNKCKNKWIALNRGIPLQINNKKFTRKYSGSQSGSSNNGSKITEQDAIDIIAMRAKGVTLKIIAEQKNISIGNVGNIVKGRSWKHLERPI